MIVAVVVRVKIDLQESLRLDSNVMMLLKPHKGEVLAAMQQAPIFRRTVYHHLMDLLLHKDLHLLLMTTVEGEEDTNQDLGPGLGLPPEAMRGIIISVEEDGEEETGT